MDSLEKWLFKSSIYFLTELLVFLTLSCMSYGYMLEINPLSVVSFVIIFSHSKACLFILFIVLLSGQKILSLIRSYLFIFLLISILWELDQRGYCCDLCQRMFCFPLRIL